MRLHSVVLGRGMMIARVRPLRKDEAFFSTAYYRHHDLQHNPDKRTHAPTTTRHTVHKTQHISSPISSSLPLHLNINSRSSLLSSLHHLSSQFQFAPVVPLIWNEKKWNFILADHIGLPLAVCGGKGGKLGFT